MEMDRLYSCDPYRHIFLQTHLIHQAATNLPHTRAHEQTTLLFHTSRQTSRHSFQYEK